LFSEIRQLISKVNIRTVKQNVQYGVGSTRIITELICKPHVVCCGIVKIRRAVDVLPPRETEDQTIRVEMVDCPWFNVIEFNEFCAFNAKTPCQRGEYTYRMGEKD
jgi:hypothetical protein